MENQLQNETEQLISDIMGIKYWPGNRLNTFRGIYFLFKTFQRDTTGWGFLPAYKNLTQVLIPLEVSL